ncbi:S4 domain-containing protein [Erythrobacter sp. HA6-11]
MSDSLRLDKFLVYCRFARTRSRAQAMIDAGAMRLNGEHVTRAHTSVALGDVLTLVQADEVRIIEIEALPERRGAPAKARSHYRELDRAG